MRDTKTKKATGKKERQAREPFLQAVVDYLASKPASFDVPGHKMGGFANDLLALIGPKAYEFDVNSPLGLDNLARSRGVIKEAEELCAKAFGAEGCLISVNGTTGGIFTEMLGVLNSKDKIILPRNVHKSIINSLIFSGAIPIFVKPDIDPLSGIANGVPVREYEKAIAENPDAKVVFAINPTYFGLTSDLKAIAALAHAHNMIAMADEAHGSHFYFSKKLPLGALQAGFDITACSLHKTGGSLTQSSVVLYKGKRVNWARVKTAFALLMSTSPSSLLIASVDAARKRLYFEGARLFGQVIALCEKARQAIAAIPGLTVIDKTYLNGQGRYDLDTTRLVIDVSALNITGFDAYQELRAHGNVQLELGEFRCCLAIFGLGTTMEQTERLIAAFKDLAARHYRQKAAHRQPHFSFQYPELIVRPRVAFNAPVTEVPYKDAVGEIAAESVMIYPPGIPLVIPGERVTLDALKQLRFYARHGGVILADSKTAYVKVIDRSRWYLASDLDLDE